MQTVPVAAGATAVAPTAAVGVRPRQDTVTTFVEITGGTARTAQWQVAPTPNGPWSNVGTSRTAIGVFVEAVPAAPHIRLNISANTGSTFNAWVFSDMPGEAR